MGDYDADFQIGGNSDIGERSADKNIGGRDILVGIGFVPDLGLLPGSGMIAFGTSGVSSPIITINALDPSGTIFSEISNWGGTDNQTVYTEVSSWMGTAGGGSPLGLLAGEAITLGSAGDVVTISGISPSGTIFSEISNWGGTLAKSGTTPSYSDISSWNGTIYSEVSNWIGTTANNWGILAGEAITLGSSGDVVTISGISPSGTIFSEISNWGGTDNQTVYSEVSNWMGTKSNANNWGIEGDTYVAVGTTGDVVSLQSQGVFTEVGAWMGTAGGGTPVGFLGTGGVTIATNGDVLSFAGARVLIATATAANSASIEFTDSVGISNYRRLYLTCEGVSGQTTAQGVYILTSSNNGGTYWGNGSYEANCLISSAASVGYGSQENNWSISSTSQIINLFGCTADCIIQRVVTGTSGPSYLSNASFAYSTINMLQRNAGFMKPLANIDAIKIQMSSGNINQGVFHLYGEH